MQLGVMLLYFKQSSACRLCVLLCIGNAVNMNDLGPPFRGSAIPEIRHSGVLLL